MLIEKRCGSVKTWFRVAAIGNRDAERGGGTVGQQWVDLKKAKDAGALSDTEYEVEKGKVLNRLQRGK